MSGITRQQYLRNVIGLHVTNMAPKPGLPFSATCRFLPCISSRKSRKNLFYLPKDKDRYNNKNKSGNHIENKMFVGDNRVRFPDNTPYAGLNSRYSTKIC